MEGNLNGPSSPLLTSNTVITEEPTVKNILYKLYPQFSRTENIKKTQRQCPYFGTNSTFEAYVFAIVIGSIE